MTTLSKINKYLARNNIDAEILPGKGYVYFSGPAVVNWYIKAIPNLENVKNITNEEGKQLFFDLQQLNLF